MNNIIGVLRILGIAGLISWVAGPLLASEPLRRHISDHTTIALPLSRPDINHLMVEHDAIRDIVCPTGFCITHTHEYDPYHGVLLSIAVDIPFTLYVSTTQGRQFSVLVTPRDIPGVTVTFIGDARPVIDATAQASEVAMPYTQQIVAVMQTMMRHHRDASVYDFSHHNHSYALDGFIVTNVAVTPSALSQAEATPPTLPQRSPGQPPRDYRTGRSLWEIMPISSDTDEQDALIFTPVQLWRGAALTGLVAHVDNPTPWDQPISEMAFYQPGVRAAALSDEIVPAHGRIKAYQVFGGRLP